MSQAQVKGLDVFAGYAKSVSTETSKMVTETQSAAVSAKAAIEATKDNALTKSYNALLTAYATFDKKLLQEQFATTLDKFAKISGSLATSINDWKKFQADTEDAIKATQSMMATLQGTTIPPIEVPAEGQSDFDAELVVGAFKEIAKLSVAREQYIKTILLDYRNNVQAQIAPNWAQAMDSVLTRMEKANNQLVQQIKPMQELTDITLINAENFKDAVSKITGALDLGGNFGQDEVDSARKGVRLSETPTF